MSSRSPYPNGHVARVARRLRLELLALDTVADHSAEKIRAHRQAGAEDPHGGKLCAVLVPRPMGYLVVRIYFHRVPVRGLAVKFFESSGGEKGAQLGEELVTGEDGIARLDMLVPAVEYVCEIENARSASI